MHEKVTIWFSRSCSGLRAHTSLQCQADTALPHACGCVCPLRFLHAPLGAFPFLHCSEVCRKDSHLQLHCFSVGLQWHSRGSDRMKESTGSHLLTSGVHWEYLCRYVSGEWGFSWQKMPASPSPLQGVWYWCGTSHQAGSGPACVLQRVTAPCGRHAYPPSFPAATLHVK